MESGLNNCQHLLVSKFMHGGFEFILRVDCFSLDTAYPILVPNLMS